MSLRVVGYILSQTVQVAILYIVQASRISLNRKYTPFTYMDPLGLGPTLKLLYLMLRFFIGIMKKKTESVDPTP